MQQNTWKYFPFPKIAFRENIYFPKNILREPNTALVAIVAYGDRWRCENELRGNLCVSVWVLDERKLRRLGELREREREREREI